MATKVKNNLGAVRTLNTLGKNSRASQKDLRKISTGEKITSAADDASAYGISERMREKIRSLDQANQNTQNDLAMMKTAEGAVANIVDVLRTLKQKAIDSANDSNTDEDRRVMQKEVDQLVDQIDDNALVTFNGKFLVDGKMSGMSYSIGTVWVAYGLYAPGDSDWNSTYHQTLKLTDLCDRDGNSLKIEEGDTFTVTHVVNGETYVRTQEVGAHLLNDLFTTFMRDASGGIVGTYAYTNKDYGGAAYSTGAVQTSVIWNSGTWASPGTIPCFPSSSSRMENTGISIFDGTETTNTGFGGVADKSGKSLIIPGDTSVGYASLVSPDSNYQLSAINITITGAEGIKKDATRALKFTRVQRGESRSDGDGGGVIFCGNLSRRSGCQSVNDSRLE